MKKILVGLTAGILIGLLAWWAAAPTQLSESVPAGVAPALGASPEPSPSPSPSPVNRGVEAIPSQPVNDGPTGTTMPPGMVENEPSGGVDAPAIAPTVGPPAVETETPQAAHSGDSPRSLIVPVAGIPRTAMRDMFNEARGNKRHEAIDILAPRGTAVIAADDGQVKKLFTSVPGGLTVYEFDPDQRYCYYYAHLDGYAPGLHEGQQLHRGDLVGYVGTTGNAPKDTPHLHFALILLDAERRWWKGTYVDPYPLLSGKTP